MYLKKIFCTGNTAISTTQNSEPDEDKKKSEAANKVVFEVKVARDNFNQPVEYAWPRTAREQQY